MANRRSRYRVRLGPDDKVSVGVVLPNGETLSGTVIDIALGGVGILFDSPPLPVFPVRGQVDLELTFYNLPRPLVAPSTVCRRTEVEDGIVYGFSFQSPEALREQIPRGLARVFNQRASERIRIDPQEPCEALIQGTLPPTSVKGSVRDLSLTGISIETQYDIGNVLILGEGVQLTLSLNGVSKKLVLKSKVTWREFLGRSVLYGIAFDSRQTSGFRKKQEVIGGYIEARRKPEDGPLPKKKSKLARLIGILP